MKNFSSGGGGKKMSTYLRSAKEKKTEERKKMGEYKKNEKGGFLNNGDFSVVKSFLFATVFLTQSWRLLVTGDEGRLVLAALVSWTGCVQGKEF